MVRIRNAGDDNIKEIIGKIVRFYNRERGFFQYGKVIKKSRMRDINTKITSTGRKVKKPTITSYTITLSSFSVKGGFNWEGDKIKITINDIEAVHHYGKDIPIKDWE